LAAFIDDENIFVASKADSGMAITVWKPNSNQSNTEMMFFNFNTATSWNSPEVQGNSSFTSNERVQLMSIAVVGKGDTFPRVAIAVNFDSEFRVLVYNGTTQLLLPRPIYN